MKAITGNIKQTGNHQTTCDVNHQNHQTTTTTTRKAITRRVQNKERARTRKKKQ